MKDTIVDSQGRAVGRVDVEELDDRRFSGSIDTQQVPDDVADLFRDYERLINNEDLTDADMIEKRIESFGFRLEKTDVPIGEVRIIGDQISFQIKPA